MVVIMKPGTKKEDIDILVRKFRDQGLDVGITTAANMTGTFWIDAIQLERVTPSAWISTKSPWSPMWSGSCGSRSPIKRPTGSFTLRIRWSL